MDLFEMGAMLQSHRKSQGRSQADLAAPLQMSRSTISGIENGTVTEIGLRKFMALCDSLGLELTLQPRSQRPTLHKLVAEAEQIKGQKRRGA